MPGSLTFLTPLGATLALVAVVPLLALVGMRRRARRLRVSLSVPDSARRAVRVAVGSLLLTGVLLGLAAAQPIYEWQATRSVRTDAEAYVVVDVSRSMLAQSSPGSAMRIERAKSAARVVRRALGDVPVGIASLTDRVLPHLFPSADEDVFAATLDRAVGVDRPPPRGAFASTATQLDALGAIRSLRFFSATAGRRVLVVVTDGETRPAAEARLRSLLRSTPVIDLVFVHVWNEDERVFTDGAPEPQYRPDPAAPRILEQVATATSAEVYGEDDVGAAGAAARALLGSGPTATRGTRRERFALAPYLSLAAFVPLALLLRRRDR